MAGRLMAWSGCCASINLSDPGVEEALYDSPRQEDIPLSIDAQYVPGFVSARQPQLRLVKDMMPLVFIVAKSATLFKFIEALAPLSLSLPQNASLDGMCPGVSFLLARRSLSHGVLESPAWLSPVCGQTHQRMGRSCLVPMARDYALFVRARNGPGKRDHSDG
jgi:hypothetical protein